EHPRRGGPLRRAVCFPRRARRPHLFSRLCECQPYTRGSGRSAQYSRGHTRSSNATERLSGQRLSLMPEPKETVYSRVESTYKTREAEGVLDLYFYRPIGFRLAELFAQRKMTPAAVTLLAGICGVVAGHLYYYTDLGVNMVGMALHVCSNALDNADGQLARLTGTESRKGRIID